MVKRQRVVVLKEKRADLLLYKRKLTQSVRCDESRGRKRENTQPHTFIYLLLIHVFPAYLT